MNNKKIISLTVKITIAIVIIIGFILVNDYIDYNRKREFEFVPDSNSYAYQVEDIRIEDDYLVIKGWFFELRSVRNSYREIENKKVGILLYDLDSEVGEYVDGRKKHKKGIVLNVEENKRTDINEYFKCDYDYSQCGFEAKIKKTKINLENGNYRIVIKPNCDSIYGIECETYINSGKLQYIQSKDEVILETKGTDIENIVKDGICLASIPENHIFIYQLGWNIYWIADSEYKFENDGGTYIHYQLETTQFDRLPAYRTDNGWFWTTIGADFEANEITSDINCGKYRVCKREIPKDYAITQIVTGYCEDDKWIWKKSIRPLFLYKNE